MLPSLFGTAKLQEKSIAAIFDLNNFQKNKPKSYFILVKSTEFYINHLINNEKILFYLYFYLLK